MTNSSMLRPLCLNLVWLISVFFVSIYVCYDVNSANIVIACRFTALCYIDAAWHCCRLDEEKQLVSSSLQNALRDKDRLNEHIKSLALKSTSGEQSYVNTIKEVCISDTLYCITLRSTCVRSPRASVVPVECVSDTAVWAADANSIQTAPNIHEKFQSFPA